MAVASSTVAPEPAEPAVVPVPGRRPTPTTASFLLGSLGVHLFLALLLPRLEVMASTATPDTLVELTFVEPKPAPVIEAEPATQPEAEAEPVAKPEPIRPQRVVRRPPPRPAAAAPPEPPPVAAAAVLEAAPGLALDRPAAPEEGVHTERAVPDAEAAPAPAVEKGPARPDLGALTRDYLKSLARELHKHRHYPRAALRERLQGTALVSITIDEHGLVHAVDLKRSSGHVLLDRSALAAVRSTRKLPVPPGALHWRTRSVTLPVAYILR